MLNWRAYSFPWFRTKTYNLKFKRGQNNKIQQIDFHKHNSNVPKQKFYNIYIYGMKKNIVFIFLFDILLASFMEKKIIRASNIGHVYKYLQQNYCMKIKYVKSKLLITMTMMII